VITSHENFVTYINLTQNGETQWFALPESQPGFYHFGQHFATVEIVATASTTLTYAAYYLSPTLGGCSVIRAACASSFVFRDLANAPVCFLVTDAGVTASVSGSIANGALVARDSARFDTAKPIPESGATLTGFFAIEIANGGPDRAAVNLVFKGGNQRYEYQELTAATRPGAVGVSGWREFEPMTEEPVYPGSTDTGVMVAWILCTFVFVILPLFAAAVMGPYLVRLKALDTAGQENYFDSQADIAPPPELGSGPPTEDSSRTDPEDPVPESPYEAPAECL
jgi:hypothetical protein